MQRNEDQNGMRIKQMYEKNLTTNKEKVAFWKFLMYSTKAEVHIHSFIALLYWVSLLEIFLFFVGIALFISSPSKFGVFWAFITHVIRAALGFILIRRIPKSHIVIEELREFENNTIEDIEVNILQTYRNLLSSKESSLKPLMICYFVFTVIDIIIDNVLFFFLQQRWADSTYSLQNFVALVTIVVFFLCNGVFFSWLGSVKFNFPIEMRKPINLAIFGVFSGIKNTISNAITNVYLKAKSKFGKGSDNEIQPVDHAEKNPQSYEYEHGNIQM